VKPEAAAAVGLKGSSTHEFFAGPTCTATQCFCLSTLPVAGTAVQGRVHRPTG